MTDYLDIARRIMAEHDAARSSPHPPPERDDTLEKILKGHAVALYCNRLEQTLWIVADEEDAKLLGEPRGCVYTPGEVEVVVVISDRDTATKIHELKRKFNAKISR